MERRQFLKVFSTGLIAIVSRCKADLLFYPETPFGAIRLMPDEVPEIYKQWWREMEKCSGRERDFSDIRWLEYPGAHVPCGDERCAETYNPASNEIVVAKEKKMEPEYVKHGIAHALKFNHKGDRFQKGSIIYDRCGIE